MELSGGTKRYMTHAWQGCIGDDLRWELDRGSVSLMVLLDLSVAFNTINHGILLTCVSGTGTWRICSTVALVLSRGERTQKVVLIDPLAADLWGPSGSCFSPMLF